MIEFIIITIITFIVSYFFIRIGISRLALIPLSFFILFIVNVLWWFSVGTITKNQIKNNWALFSWWIIIVGIISLLINQWLVWYYVVAITITINILLYLSSYQRSYPEGKSVFLWWTLMTFISAIVYVIRTQQYSSIATIFSVGSILYFIIFTLLPYIFQDLTEDDKVIIEHQKEISLYACISVILYRIFQPYYNAVIVSQLAFTTLLIGVRQTYLTKKIEIKHEKKDWLSGRALLEWQKVLEWYDDKNRSLDLYIFNFLIKNNYMPSSYGMIVLQYLQILLIIVLVLLTIQWLLNNISNTLLWYRLWVASFIITLFWIQSQEKFINYYKTIAIWLITWSYYITLFDATSNSSMFTWGSLIRLCINMITCLFYEDIFPKATFVFSKKDILFWLSMIIIGSIITIISLIWLPLNWSILFALGCIIIGIVSYFSYHIWKKLNY